MTTRAYPYGFCPECGADHLGIDPEPLQITGAEEEGVVVYQCKWCGAMTVDGYFLTEADAQSVQWK